MGSQRREFSPEYKDEAVKLVVNTGRPVATVARELGVKEQTLGRWVLAYKARQEAGDGVLSETERVELARLTLRGSLPLQQLRITGCAGGELSSAQQQATESRAAA